MDVLTLGRVLLRRWYVIVALLVVTAGAVYFIAQNSSPVYGTSGSVLFADPSMQSVEERQGEEVSAMGVVSPPIIAALMQDSVVQERVRTAAGAVNYNVSVGDQGVLVVAARSDNQAALPRAVEVLLSEVQRLVAERQEDAGVSADESITVEVLSTPSVASVVDTDAEGAVVYEAVGTVQMIGVVGRENPYANVQFAFNLLAEVGAGGTLQLELADQGVGGTFTLMMDTPPIMRISATAAEPDQARPTYDAAVGLLAAELEERQERLEIPVGDRTRLQELNPPSPVVAQTDGLVRPLVTVAGLGLVVAVGAAMLVDNVAVGLARRRAAGGDVDADDDDVRADDADLSMGAPDARPESLPDDSDVRDRPSEEVTASSGRKLLAARRGR